MDARLTPASGAMHSRRPALFAAAALAAFFLPQLWGRQVYSRVTWRLLVPCRAFLGDELRAGEFPGWYPYEALRHALSRAGGLRRPASALVAVGLPAARERAVAADPLRASRSPAWEPGSLRRVLGAAPVGCAIAAVSYALSGYFVAATDNIVFLWSAAHLPIQLAAFALGGPARLVARPAGRGRAGERLLGPHGRRPGRARLRRGGRVDGPVAGSFRVGGGISPAARWPRS